MQNELENLIDQINDEFIQTTCGTFVRKDTGEQFTQTEVKKYISRRLEDFSVQQFANTKEVFKDTFGIKTDQRIINKRSKKVNTKNKESFDNGDFNIVYKNTRILTELINMKLETNEKLVYYVLRDFISFPSNSVLINGEVPKFIDLEPLVGLKERTIRKALKGLEKKGLIKLVQAGVRKSIFFNPYYYASGKELSIDTLKMFELLECDDNKIEQYIKIDK